MDLTDTKLIAEVAQWNVRLEAATPEQIIYWAVKKFGPHIVMGTGFSPNSIVLLHMVHWMFPDIRAIFVNPGDIPLTNLEYAKTVKGYLPKLKVKEYEPDAPLSEEDRLAISRGGKDRLEVYSRRKLPLMRKALEEHGAKAILYGARFDQNLGRSRFSIVKPDEKQVMRIYPSLYREERDHQQYIIQHDLPVHPDGMPGGERAGCGLHDDTEDS